MNKITLENIDSIFNESTIKLGSLKGQYNNVRDNVLSLENDILDLKDKQEIETKSVELLNLVQKATRDQTKEQFEKLVTYAIQYIFEDNNFEFALEFDRRGALGTLDFNIKTPELKEKADIIDTDSGGLINIVSLALRLVILETLIPKNEGFLIFDESFKNLSEEYINQASQFLKDISRKINRQIIMITHKEQFKIHADNIINLDKLKGGK